MATTVIAANGVVTVLTDIDTGIVRDGLIFIYASGSSEQSKNFIPEGGAVFGGSSLAEHFGGIYYDDLIASGGAIFGGSATVEQENLNIADHIASGGAVFGGSAEIDSLKSANHIASGGAIFGGNAASAIVGSHSSVQRTIIFTCT